MNKVKNVTRAVYWYGIMPVLVLWVAGSVLAMYTYVVKGLIFMATGSASIIGATGPVAMVPAPIESLAGLALWILSAGTFILFRYYALQAQHQGSPDDVPLMEMLSSASSSSMPILDEEPDLTGVIEQLNFSHRQQETTRLT